MSAPLGFGLGLRTKHYGWILDNRPAVDWFEIVSENFLSVGGRPRRKLAAIREHYPLVAHGVGLSIGSTDNIPEAYLTALAQLVHEIEPRFVTDHLCWTRHHGQNSHDLLPLAYTRAALRHVKERVQHVQDRLKRRIFLENPSAYVSFTASEMDEASFLRELCDVSGCGVLLDVNNLYVNAQNLGMDADAYLNAMRAEDICYFHLAGHTVLPDIRIDTHDEPVPPAVWELYREAARRFPHVPTLLEWDDNLPEFPQLMAELEQARAFHTESTRGLSLNGVTAASFQPRLAMTDAPDIAAWKITQDAFWDVMTSPVNVAPNDERAAKLVDSSRATKAERGLNAYVDAYFFRIAASICETYPSLNNVLGNQNFYRLLKPFLAVHPPTEANLKYAARALPEYLMTCDLPADCGVPQRVLRDLAALEWARADIYDEADNADLVSIESLMALQPDDWESVRFVFVKALRLVHCDFAIEPVLAAVACGAVPERPVAAATFYLVTRPADDPEIEVVDDRPAALLTALLAGESFLDACTAAATKAGLDELDGDFVGMMIGYLREWVGRGLVGAMQLP